MLEPDIALRLCVKTDLCCFIVLRIRNLSRVWDAETGSSVWQASYTTDYECEYSNYSSGPYSTPVIDEQSVFVQSATGILRALSMGDGAELWKRDLPADFEVPGNGYAAGHSPLLSNGKLILNVAGNMANSAVVALDPETGSTVWTSGTIEAQRNVGSHGTPVAAIVHGRPLVFVVTPVGLSCLRDEDGQVLWTVPFATDSRDTPNSTTPVVFDDMVFASMFRAGAFCLKVASDGSYEELWNNRRSIESCYNPVTCIDGFLYGWHSFDRTLRCVDLKTGVVRWKERTILARGNHIVVDDRLLVLGEQGHLGCIRLSSSAFESVFVSESPWLSGPCYTMPALSGRRLFLRNEQRLMCLDLNPAKSNSGTFDIRP